MRVVELIVAQCKNGSDEFTQKRRSLVARWFCKVVFFGVEQITVPLAIFWIESMISSEIPGNLRYLMCFSFILIQVLGLYLFNYSTIRRVMPPTFLIGLRVLPPDYYEDFWQFGLESLNCSSLLGFEIYKYEYRYWILIEIGYDLLNGLLVAIGSNFLPELYWFNVVLHGFYTYSHAVLRPSFYSYHNWLSVWSGGSELFADIAVLESIYGDGVLGESPWWCIVALFIPLLVSIGQFIYEYCSKEEEESVEEDSYTREKDEEFEVVLKNFSLRMENGAVIRSWRFLSCLLLVSIIFIQLASFAGAKPPLSRAKTSVTVMVSIYLIVLSVTVVFILLWRLLTDDVLAKHERIIKKHHEIFSDEIPWYQKFFICCNWKARVENETSP
jgi:hypothetical protein